MHSLTHSGYALSGCYYYLVLSHPSRKTLTDKNTPSLPKVQALVTVLDVAELPSTLHITVTRANSHFKMLGVAAYSSTPIGEVEMGGSLSLDD